MKSTLAAFCLVTALLGAAPCGARAQTHPSQQPPLAGDSVFPRCTPQQLEEGGFPDHLHAYWWPGWQPLTDAAGQTYGPGSFCQRKKVVPRPGLIVAESEKRFGHFVVKHNPAYKDCDLLPFLETLVWAGRRAEDLLGLTVTDTLTVISPDNIKSYREQTGQDVWRLYKLDGDTCVSEPYGTLQARTLDGHAAFQLVHDWVLRENLGDRLPPWLHQGLVEYLSEDGVHLVNYMGQFREQGDLLFSAPLVDAILQRGVDPDPARDREMYRRACYSAFLMAWRLVEDNGGLVSLRRFLELAAGPEGADHAAREVYGAQLTELALRLDPAKLGEPIGTATQSRTPHLQP